MKFTLNHSLTFFIFLATSLISHSEAIENTNPFQDATNQNNQGTHNDTDLGVWNQVYNFLMDNLKKNPYLSQQIDSLFEENNSSDIQEFLSDPLNNIFNGNTSFMDALKEAFNTPVVQQMVSAGEMAANAYVETYLNALGVTHSCYNDMKWTLDGLSKQKDWALRSKFRIYLPAAT